MLWCFYYVIFLIIYQIVNTSQKIGQSTENDWMHSIKKHYFCATEVARLGQTCVAIHCFAVHHWHNVLRLAILVHSLLALPHRFRRLLINWNGTLKSNFWIEVFFQEKFYFLSSLWYKVDKFFVAFRSSLFPTQPYRFLSYVLYVKQGVLKFLVNLPPTLVAVSRVTSGCYHHLATPNTSGSNATHSLEWLYYTLAT